MHVSNGDYKTKKKEKQVNTVKLYVVEEGPVANKRHTIKRKNKTKQNENKGRGRSRTDALSDIGEKKSATHLTLSNTFGNSSD